MISIAKQVLQLLSDNYDLLKLAKNVLLSMLLIV